jgi:nucleolar pre-ribosomal-associated protein 1
LYERTQVEGDEEDYIPANLVHHFLLAICTRPGSGICFKDRAWYGREAEGDEPLPREEANPKLRSGKIYNKILSNVVKTLKVNEDSRQQELALKILSACPELVSGFVCHLSFVSFYLQAHFIIDTGQQQHSPSNRVSLPNG